MSLPALADLLASMRVINVPLTREFRGTHHREYVIFEGPQGFGEFGPFHDHSLDHSALWLRAAFEMAFEDMPPVQRTVIPVNAIVPALEIPEVEPWIMNAYKTYGTRVFKVKCGSAEFKKDFERIDEIRYVLDHNLAQDWSLRIDVNGAWSSDQAIERIPVLQNAAADRIEYVEQPVASLADCAYVRSRVDVKIAVDEAVRLVADARLSADALRESADVAILKSIPLGGVKRSLEIAKSLELPCVVSGSMDTSLGLTSGLHLAASLPELFGACGFGTGQLLADDIVAPTTVAHDGAIQLAPVSLDADAIARAEARVDSATYDYWKARVIACYELLEG